MEGNNHGGTRAPAAEARVGWGEIWRWFAPWLGGAALVALGLLGLFVASRAADQATYAGGFAAAAIAAVTLAWRVRSAFEDRQASAALLVEDSEALIVLVAVLVVLGLLGLFLAARGAEPMAIYGGYGLFAGALVMIFWNVKHYFDRLER
ncbi:MAG TPA: hypothetical protein VGU20_17840 [Stellaceae bacterium]|nr:hypothetical protein [Stellaceae bacterium]